MLKRGGRGDGKQKKKPGESKNRHIHRQTGTTITPLLNCPRTNFHCGLSHFQTNIFPTSPTSVQLFSLLSPLHPSTPTLVSSLLRQLRFPLEFITFTPLSLPHALSPTAKKKKPALRPLSHGLPFLHYPPIPLPSHSHHLRALHSHSSHSPPHLKPPRHSHNLRPSQPTLCGAAARQGRKKKPGRGPRPERTKNPNANLTEDPLGSFGAS
jgi:hypothetical protein